ncbi:MAG: fasciclin domain-containing protein [Salinivirgaceae bacterium]|jgi:uncharacterized surface protein with fasciclin (FAS1) repeats|nr:fasciclin domain-containing protein [Salinivirgaceae bacterium]
MYEYAWEELEDENGEYGALYNRKRSYSVPIDYKEKVLYYESLIGETVLLARTNTHIPVWTTEYFSDYFGNPDGSDYLFMYPGSSWSGTQWHDAMVIDFGDPDKENPARSSTGFIYYIDRVVSPMPTIDKYLSENPKKYGVFFDIAQRFASYSSAGLNEQNERIYRKSYSSITNIANTDGPGGDPESQMVDYFSSFIPYDHVLQDYLDNRIFKYYNSLDSVPELYLTYLLQSHLGTFLVLPSKMDKRFFNYYGDKIDIDINNDIGDSKMCSNGIMYSMNKVIEPNAFTCVPGPIFYNSNYTTFLFALNNSGLLTSLTQPEIDVTLFAPTNEELLEYGIRENKSGNTTIIQKRASDGTWDHTLTDFYLQEFVSDYYHYGITENFDGEGYIRMASDNYLHYKNGQIVGGGNQNEGDYCTVKEKIQSEKNGNLFYINNTIKKPLTVGEFIFNDPDLSSFANLLLQAELVDSVQVEFEQDGVKVPGIRFVLDISIRQWSVLAPTNQALADAEAAGLIPTERDELRNFIQYHFVRNQCVFDDGKFSGSVNTQTIDEVIGSDIIYEKLLFTNTVNNLSVRDKTGQVVNIAHIDANNLVERGVIHKINSVLITGSLK